MPLLKEQMKDSPAKFDLNITAFKPGISEEVIVSFSL